MLGLYKLFLQNDMRKIKMVAWWRSGGRRGGAWVAAAPGSSPTPEGAILATIATVAIIANLAIVAFLAIIAA